MLEPYTKRTGLKPNSIYVNGRPNCLPEACIVTLASQLTILEETQNKIGKNLPLGEERSLKKKASEGTRDILTVNHCRKYVEWRK